MSWEFEKEAGHKGFNAIAGVDEAGRGPLAGPVVSASVILPFSFVDDDITDSKKLTPKKRDRLHEKIYEEAVSIGVGIVESDEIDQTNILKASLRSMLLAVNDMDIQPDFLLIDGKFAIPFLNLPQKPIIKGDALSISISAASIIAKVTRDRIMAGYHQIYPQYGFSGHKGYPTKAHKAAVKEFGPCPIHRRTFRGVKEFVDPLFTDKER